MVYDDDEGPTQFHDIPDELLDRRREARRWTAPTPNETLRNSIIDVAMQNPLWDVARVHALVVRRQGDVTVDHVHAVITELRRAERP